MNKKKIIIFGIIGIMIINIMTLVLSIIFNNFDIIAITNSILFLSLFLVSNICSSNILKENHRNENDKKIKKEMEKRIEIRSMLRVFIIIELVLTISSIILAVLI